MLDEGGVVRALAVTGEAFDQAAGTPEAAQAFIAQFIGKTGPFIMGNDIRNDALKASPIGDTIVLALNQAIEQLGK